MKIIPQDRWIAFSHELIHHGRQICVARTPRCADCTLETGVQLGGQDVELALSTSFGHDVRSAMSIEL